MSIGPMEWVLIIGVIVLLFGAKRIPETMRQIGRSLNEFKKGMKEGEEEKKDPPH